MARVEALSIVDALAAELRQRVFSGDLTHSDALTEAEVARTYEVARPTAKAAIVGLTLTLALGHLHRPQQVTLTGSSTVLRYSGSPIAFSFSEKDDTKSVTLVEHVGIADADDAAAFVRSLVEDAVDRKSVV